MPQQHGAKMPNDCKLSEGKVTPQDLRSGLIFKVFFLKKDLITWSEVTETGPEHGSAAVLTEEVCQHCQRRHCNKCTRTFENVQNVKKFQDAEKTIFRDSSSAEF